MTPNNQKVVFFSNWVYKRVQKSQKCAIHCGVHLVFLNLKPFEKVAIVCAFWPKYTLWGGRWTIYHKGVHFPNFFVFLTFSRYISNVISSYFTVFSKNMSMRVSWFWQKHESWGLFRHFLIKLTLVYLYIFNVFKTNLQ